ncbi:methylenetetrahydrofolate reductase C-terminal domain-containing protein [Pelomicrobium sp. G1]|uniref:methylenetetrahydrofolate reductase C-terminal domain-containing protein n=1 Tax=unclassified Pelomicrobium TaxID=2815318 RepID=UPI003F7614C4
MSSVAPLAIHVGHAIQPGANALSESLRDGRFFWTIEFIPSVDKVLRDELHKLGGIAEIMKDESGLAGFSVTDRVVSDRDPDPIAAASHLLDHSGKQPLVHFSGKGRELDQFQDFLQRMEDNGLENILILTGDRLKEEPMDRRPRYLESVPAIYEARRAYPNLLIAAALNPFKYREEDAMAQYLKLGKKVGAGANFIITQIGFDMLKYEEALFWVEARGYRIPLVANVMPLSAARARYMRQHQLPGVTVTDSMLSLLEAEERLMSDKGASRVLRRLALQILGVRFYGYAGVQITGIHSIEKLRALQAELRELSDLCTDRVTWSKAWNEALALPEGGQADPAPAHEPWYLARPRVRRTRTRERVKYSLMDRVHSFMFDRGLAARAMAPLLRPIRRHGLGDALLERVERAIKGPLFGCETCGMCRLAATQYVCPETCPKGLANGPCGGTSENLCEFRDRECIHSIKYRIARDVGVLHELETWIIPAVPAANRHTSSWPPHFRGEGPQITLVPHPKVGFRQGAGGNKCKGTG